jgi:hypothetical protein
MIEKSKLVVVAQGVGVIQWCLFLILVLVLMQILLTSYYSVSLLIVAIWTSYGLAFSLMIFLAWKFFVWFRHKRSYIVLGYLISVAIISTNVAITMIFTTQVLQAQPGSVMESIIHRSPMISESPFSSYYFFSEIFAFSTLWVASSLLLRHYTTLSTTKYWAVMAIPLIYYLSQFQPFIVAFLSGYLLSDPLVFTALYAITFTAIKPLGGFLFGLAFWLISRRVESKFVKDYLFISGSGLLLFFASNQAILLLSYPYPPLGLVAICYLGLSSYLILAGVYSSAVSVAQDDKLRRLIRKSIEQQANLLDSIGTSEMHDKIFKKVVQTSKIASKSMEDETKISPSLTSEQIASYINEVMKERGIIEKK